MLRRDLYRIKTGIESCANLKNEASINFAYTLATLYEEIIKEIEIIEKSKKETSSTFTEYQEQIKLLQLNYGVKREDGSILTHNDAIVLRNPIEYNTKIKELNIKYKKAIADQEKIDKEFEAFLNESINTTFTKIPLSLFPTNINVGIILMLNPVIIK